mmetsp:Transcript_108947/g.307027  ORF Transcript_108947/g.307027 Transcript_108947/m.307027 type:complete len:331 (-) Transcript_108947:96-1088(-)
MAVAMRSGARTAATAAGIGVAAGCMGTWFEMSHGIVCIPVLTLPPLALPQHVAVGSTVFGVAARQLLSAGLYGLDPNTDLSSEDAIDDLIDVPAALGLALSGSAAALSGAALTRIASQRQIRRSTGAFLGGVALFLQWREFRAKVAAEAADRKAEDVVEQAADTPSGVAKASLQAARHEHLATSRFEWPRYMVLGAASGFVLGFFGIGPAWMLAPVMSHMAPAAPLHAATARPAAMASDEVGNVFGSDERTRRTCCVAMVPPCVVAALRHFQFGHVPNGGTIALPLAAGAILGSAMGGTLLEDVPCEEDFRMGLSVLLFAYGGWCMFRPG